MSSGLNLLFAILLIDVIVDLAIQFCHFQDACRNTTSSSIHCSTPEAVNSIAGTTVAACSTTASVASMAAAAAATKRKLLDDTELKSDVKKVSFDKNHLK